MCKKLKIARSLIYYKRKNKRNDIELENLIIKIFRESRNNYGSRKIKKLLNNKNYKISIRKIRILMNLNGLVSNYTIKQFKPSKVASNNDLVDNVLNREFNTYNYLDVIVSDLTYVRVQNSWHYICLILNLSNREIVGYSSGNQKNAELVYRAFSKIKHSLNDIRLFHTDRGNEFKNKIIDDLLKTFNIQRSLSNKGCPYDNSVAEATYKIIKTEFAFNRTFASAEELASELMDYVNWYNTIRIHGSLDYLTPVEYKNMQPLKNCPNYC